MTADNPQERFQQINDRTMPKTQEEVVPGSRPLLSDVCIS